MDYFNAQWEKYNYKMLQDTLKGVCSLHKKVTSVDEDGKEYYYCDACTWSYPCPTMKVVNETYTIFNVSVDSKTNAFGYGIEMGYN